MLRATCLPRLRPRTAPEYESGVADALIGASFAGYRVDELVGRGGMGVVYRATDVALERSVALKLLAPELARDESFRRRFASESKVAASLDHPNVIPIYAAGEHDGVLYLAMRFVRGEDLRLRLHREGRLAPGAAAGLVAQVGSALDAAHEAGLVHRDVKPANVLLDGHEHAYLTDFGLTKRIAADTIETRTGQILGTLDYIAPEQIRGERLGPFTDVYALACMTFHLLTGEVPFPVPTEEGKLWAHLSEPPPRPSERHPGLPKAVDAVLARAMAKDPALRYATAGELASATVGAVAAPPRRRADPAARVAAARARHEVPAPARAEAPPPSDPRRAYLTEALREPFNLAVLGVLVVVGIALGTPLLMLALALVVYAAAVARSYLDPATRRRALGRRTAGG
jgi:serine/threonine protein kinase